MADIEPPKPGNADWLIVDVVAETAVFGGRATEMDLALDEVALRLRDLVRPQMTALLF